MADFREGKWWAWQGLNLRPLRCQGRGTRDFPLKSAVFYVPDERTSLERNAIPKAGYRTFTAHSFKALAIGPEWRARTRRFGESRRGGIGHLLIAQGIEAGTGETPQDGSTRSAKARSREGCAQPSSGRSS